MRHRLPRRSKASNRGVYVAIPCTSVRLELVRNHIGPVREFEITPSENYHVQGKESLPAEFRQLYKERPCPIQLDSLQLLQELHPEKRSRPLPIRYIL
jgi:hypothetical protein